MPTRTMNVHLLFCMHAHEVKQLAHYVYVVYIQLVCTAYSRLCCRYTHCSADLIVVTFVLILWAHFNEINV